MLIQFSISGLGDKLFSLPLEELSQEFISLFKKGGRYSSCIRVDDVEVDYGFQPLSGILFDYVCLLKDLASGQDHQLLIDGYPIAEIGLSFDKMRLDFGTDRAGNAKKFSVERDEYRSSLTDTIHRIAFGIYMLDMAELAKGGIAVDEIDGA